MSAMCQMRTHAVQQTATPFKHLVSERVRLARTARDGAIPGLDWIALSTEVPFIFDHQDSHPLCVHGAFFKAQSEGSSANGDVRFTPESGHAQCN
jgi:hypothetical protein